MYIISDNNNMPLLPREKEPINEGGGILAAQVELRVACIWTFYISIFQGMQKMQRKKNVCSV